MEKVRKRKKGKNNAERKKETCMHKVKKRERKKNISREKERKKERKKERNCSVGGQTVILNLLYQDITLNVEIGLYMSCQGNDNKLR